MKQLNEKVAIITGCGQEIGKGVALYMAKRGVRVACIGRRLGPVEETAKEIEALGSQVIAISCDTSDREGVMAEGKKTVETFGSVDILINNAQSLPPSAPVEDTLYESMYLAWSTCTIGSVNFMQDSLPMPATRNPSAVLPKLQQKSGRNTASR